MPKKLNPKRLTFKMSNASLLLRSSLCEITPNSGLDRFLTISSNFLCRVSYSASKLTGLDIAEPPSTDVFSVTWELCFFFWRRLSSWLTVAIRFFISTESFSPWAFLEARTASVARFYSSAFSKFSSTSWILLIKLKFFSSRLVNKSSSYSVFWK